MQKSSCSNRITVQPRQSLTQPRMLYSEISYAKTNGYGPLWVQVRKSSCTRRLTRKRKGSSQLERSNVYRHEAISISWGMSLLCTAPMHNHAHWKSSSYARIFLIRLLVAASSTSAKKLRICLLICACWQIPMMT